MQLSFRNSILLLLILSGFVIFLSNALKLNLNNENIFLTNDENKIIKLNKKDVEITKIEENISLNDISQNKKSIKLREVIVKVKKGQTFLEILDNFNFKNKKKYEITKSINKLFNLRELDINQRIIFFIDINEIIKKIIIEIDFKTNLVVSLESQIKIEKKELKTYSTIESKEYYITDSLYSDGVINKLPNEILIKLIQLFSFDLDFQRDIIKDTQVSVSYNRTNVENKSDYSFGDIEYARISIRNNNLEYFKFLTNEGFNDYFNREGKNVKKSILKTPLDGAKLSSSFGMRKHPSSGFNKMHKGVDFAAPSGTPIYAGGNGVVEVAGVNGGYGKYIRIRHNNGYKTAYAHLSGFKKGLNKGVRVSQGEVIGYVGSTGKSTGPHLHYEIIYQNQQINPLTLKLPSGKILKGNELKKFEKNYKRILADHLNNLFE